MVDACIALPLLSVIQLKLVIIDLFLSFPVDHICISYYVTNILFDNQ